MKRLILLCVLLASLCCMAQPPHNAAYPHDPAFTPLPESERGTLLGFQLESTGMYQGTSRSVSVYVPKQYDGSKPACLLVCMDGILYQATTVMDYLISKGEMPVTIGVFITSGTIKDNEGKALRYDRCYEFDSVNGSFAHFLETQILPMVEKMTMPDGTRIMLSKDANDRAITGASSGGICAFTAAWERPDMFSRVFTAVGTFVSMRGGHEYPYIVRKTEPKPLRIYMQDGIYDVWNPVFGEWWEANQLMESALDFAGYELFIKWDRGGHGIKHGTQLFPDVMRWLWKGWPERVAVGNSRNGLLQTLLDGASEWKPVDIDLPQDACLSNCTDAGIYLRSGKEVSRIDTLGNVSALIQSRKNMAPSYDRNIAYYPGGRLLARISPDSNMALQSVLVDGEYRYEQEFYCFHGKPTQLYFDTLGNLYGCTEYGIEVCDHNGRVRAILPVKATPADWKHPGSATSIAWAGNYIFVISGGRLYMRKMGHRGFCDPFTTPEPASQGQG